MNIRKLLLPTLIATVLMAPAALAQVSVGAKGGTALGAQVGPVGAKAQVGVDAAAHSDAVHQAADAAKAAGEQVGDSVKDVARTGAKAANKASTRAADTVSGNAKAKANAAVTGKASTDDAEPEEDDGI
ncbi:MAG: hypothetical protein ACYC42_03125 [Lysobacter sp.]